MKLFKISEDKVIKENGHARIFKVSPDGSLIRVKAMKTHAADEGDDDEWEEVDFEFDFDVTIIVHNGKPYITVETAGDHFESAAEIIQQMVYDEMIGVEGMQVTDYTIIKASDAEDLFEANDEEDLTLDYDNTQVQEEVVEEPVAQPAPRAKPKRKAPDRYDKAPSRPKQAPKPKPPAPTVDPRLPDQQDQSQFMEQENI
jgi:hypothetical protein